MTLADELRALACEFPPESSLREGTLGLADRVAEVERGMAAWREYAQHQESCAVCAENVEECEIGLPLRDAARKGASDV